MRNFANANKETDPHGHSLFSDKHIGIWCNGNTTDSGPVILGSSPSIPTKKAYSLRIGFFRIWKILLNLMALIQRLI